MSAFDNNNATNTADTAVPYGTIDTTYGEGMNSGFIEDSDAAIYVAHDRDDVESSAAASLAEMSADNVPLIGDTSSLSSLETEYRDNAKFLAKVHSLQEHYTAYRPVRRDGSCFYRSYLYGILEYALTHRNAASVHQLALTIKNSLEYLVKHGFDRIAIEDFHEYTNELVEWAALTAPVSDDTTAVMSELSARMNDASFAPYITSYLRMITSAHLKQNAERYSPFLFETNHSSMETFCAHEVEPSDRDADHLQCVALSEFLQMKLRIEYIDLSDGPPTHYEMPESIQSETAVTLLYRPGHYDVLYK